MKLLHTADWHLGKRLERFSRLDEQQEVLDEICQIADEHQVDAVLIAGDLFDTFNPPTEAIDLFYKTLKRLSLNGKRLVVAIAGNHDSPDRIEAPEPLAKECGILLVGYPNTFIHPFELSSGLKLLNADKGFIEIQLPEIREPLRLILTPYANELRLRSFLGLDDPEQELRELLQQHWQTLAERYCDDNGVNILMAHLFFVKQGEEPGEEPEEEKPILHVGGAQAIHSSNIPPQIQYVALGHLHRKQVVADDPCPMIYSSSPLCYSMSEAEQTKYVMIVEAHPGEKVSINEIPLTSGRTLYRKRFEDVGSAVDWLKENPDALVELTIVTPTYLTAEERKRLSEAHSGIVAIIPLLSEALSDTPSHGKSINLENSMEELFKSYFIYKHNQPPGEELIELFREIQSVEREKG
ncbi:MAG: exonuclease SbcCD subunit D [Calditrichaeota bacterium]|nr:MAG: exonuclease SbcCD subunit D [Calditrichota bacterium]